MLSKIGLAAVRQVRVAHLGGRTTTTIPTRTRVAAVFARGYAETVRAKTTTSASAKPAKPEKTAGKEAAKAPKELTAAAKTRLKIKDLQKKALLENIGLLPRNSWMLYYVQHCKPLMQNRPAGVPLKDFMRSLMAQLKASYDAVPAAEREVSWFPIRAACSQTRAANQRATNRNWRRR